MFGSAKGQSETLVEPLISGIVLGLIPVTISGLLVTAHSQYCRGDQLHFYNPLVVLLKELILFLKQVL